MKDINICHYLLLKYNTCYILIITLNIYCSKLPYMLISFTMSIKIITKLYNTIISISIKLFLTIFIMTRMHNIRLHICGHTLKLQHTFI